MTKKLFVVAVVGMFVAMFGVRGDAQPRPRAADFIVILTTDVGTTVQLHCGIGCDWPDAHANIQYRCEKRPCIFEFNGHGPIVRSKPTN